MLCTAVTSLCCMTTPLSSAGLQKMTVMSRKTPMATMWGMKGLKEIRCI